MPGKGKDEKMKKKKWMIMMIMVFALSLMFGTTVCAAGTGDVAGAIEGTWNDASDQIKSVVNKVVFPAIDLILAVSVCLPCVYPDSTDVYLENSRNVGGAV